MHRRREIQSLVMHRRIAAMLERDPDAVLGKAMRNLRAWMEGQRKGEAVAVFPSGWICWRERPLTASPPSSYPKANAP